MKRPKKQTAQFYDSLFDALSYQSFYRDRLTDIALSCVKWKNLPEEIDPRFLEWCLFYDGMAIFFKDDITEKFVCIQVMPSGQFNMYRIPKERTAYAVNGYQNSDLNEHNSVIIYNNLLRKPSVQDIEIYAKKLTNIDLTLNVNVNAQKTPILLKGTQQQRLSLLNAYEKYDGNQPVMFGTENFLEGNENAFTVFKTDCPYVADKLYELKVNLWNEALTYLGVASSVIQKKERMIKDEVNQLQGGVMANRYSRLNARQQACEEINRMFGTNMSVEFRDIFEQNKNSDTGSEGNMDE